MDPAFLLPAFDRVVTAVEVRNKDPIVAPEELTDDAGNPRSGRPEHHVSTVGEDPDKLLCALDIYLRLIGVDKRAAQERRLGLDLGFLVALGEVPDEVDDRALAHRLIELLFYALNDGVVLRPRVRIGVSSRIRRGLAPLSARRHGFDAWHWWERRPRSGCLGVSKAPPPAASGRNSLHDCT